MSSRVYIYLYMKIRTVQLKAVSFEINDNYVRIIFNFQRHSVIHSVGYLRTLHVSV